MLQLSGGVLTVSGDVRVHGSLAAEGEMLMQGHSLACGACAAESGDKPAAGEEEAEGEAAKGEAADDPPLPRYFARSTRVNATDFLNTARVYAGVKTW